MRRSLVAAILALLLLSWPAQATTDHTLIDAIVKVAPGEDSGFCVALDSAGTMHVTMQTTDGRDDDPLGAPLFMLAPYRTSPPGANAPGELWNVPATVARTAIDLHVVQDLYCFNFRLNSTPEIDGSTSAERRARFRYVALNLTLTTE